MHSSAKAISIINVRLTHKNARVPLLEAASFKDKGNAFSELLLLDSINECVILQTCNRVELYLVSENGEAAIKAAKSYLANRAGFMSEEASKAIECAVNEDAFRHILKIASGLESMVIGEDQVINQLWNAYVAAENAKAAGTVLKHLFFRAVTVGQRVRKETSINKGAVSVGSAAVELAESLLGNFDDKKIVVMGAGETGTLVAKALARRCLCPIFIANRTYDRAVRLAEELSGKAVRFDKLAETILDADVVICSTSAPHYLLTTDIVSSLLVQRSNKNDLLIIDISNPRNVEKTIADLEKVKLYNIDDLQLIAERNKQQRQDCVCAANKIIDEELFIVNRAMKTENVSKLIAEVLSRTEEIRQKELTKALNMMGTVDDREKKILGDLTSILLKQTFVPLIENLRMAAMDNDIELLEAAPRLFKMTSQKSNHETGA
ncbi:MAG: glutamyl-tRNA reductase [Candidatus Bathyarchaeota archaeon]|nr:glutamyl-tRNA reductase [Candidatus Bathyarchaeota archaeon]